MGLRDAVGGGTPSSMASRTRAATTVSALPAVEQRRRALGLSREALAALAGVSVRTVQYIERQGRRPHPRTVLALAEGLDCAPAELLAAPDVEDDDA
jgi:DNA-binding XRE family transcriptional regulator